jgi:hypothetical protein
MDDAPTSAELLDAVARVLSEQVLPETDGATRHAVRVAANLCRIAGRDVASGGGHDIDRALAELVGQATTDDLARLLDERLLERNAEFDESVADLLFADVCRRVDIAKPGYRTETGAGE